MKGIMLWLLLVLASASFGQAGVERVFNGNRFVLGMKAELDTLVVVDPITGQETVAVRETDPLPVSMNGVHISSVDEVDTPATSIVPASSIEEQIISAFKTIWGQFPYEITLLIGIKNIIVDRNGKIVYTDYRGLRAIDTDKLLHTMGGPESEMLFKDIVLKPAVKKGRTVLCAQRVFLDRFEVGVKNHELSVHRK